jgi:nucleoside-diphosphate-sugar epimerase
MDACAAAGVKRFVLVSAVDVRDRALPPPQWYGAADRDRSDRVWAAIGPYMTAKFEADKELRMGNARRGLEYTIVRPGGLTLKPGTGKVAAGKVSLGNGISREDVAMVVIECLKNRGTIGLAFDVVGGETDIQKAIQDVADHRIDCFEGYY